MAAVGVAIEIPELSKASADGRAEMCWAQFLLTPGAKVPEQRPIVGKEHAWNFTVFVVAIIFLQDVQHQKTQEH